VCVFGGEDECVRCCEVDGSVFVVKTSGNIYERTHELIISMWNITFIIIVLKNKIGSYININIHINI
jgi:hypothetical protein